MITSSAVGLKTNGRSWRSVKRSSSGPIFSERPVSSHNSNGCTTGIKVSIAPALSISWRTMFSTLRSTRRPVGSQV
ncbi:Uncharacterised protein [Vibrio cholerae]|nr:Uncharacterised protein [Vibrio cholerae]